MAQVGAPPFAWTAEIEDEILTRLQKGHSLVDICEDDWLPSQTTVYKRLREDAEFAQRYARAREVQADTLFDEILQIADDGRNDWMVRNGEDNAGYVENGEALRRSELRISARKWMASKLRPKVYGDKTTTEVTGKDGADLIPPTDPMETARRVAFLLASGLEADNG